MSQDFRPKTRTFASPATKTIALEVPTITALAHEKNAALGFQSGV